jgi:hydrogenase maturation protease
MTAPQLLIAGIGNIFLGDDAFGCEVIRRLRPRAWPAHVNLVDYGIRGLDLAYALMDDYDTVILVDATPQGDVPGTVYQMELRLEDAGEAAAVVDAHSLHPLNVLRLVRSFGGSTGRLLLVGCEPADLGEDADGRMGLSEPAQAGVEQALRVIDALVAEFLHEADAAQPGMLESIKE